MIENPKIGQKVWFLEPWGQCIHSAKITALGETEVSVRNPEKYPYADIEWDDGGNSGCLLKKLYASREELQKELKKEELKQQQVELWRRTLQICTRLFHTSTSYKKLHAIETAKFKKEREEKQKEINSIQKEINEVFIEAIQELREQYPKLTQEELFYCILQYLRLSTSTIKFCMRVESNQALTQRKYRIKKQISPQTFSIIFNESSPSEGVL